MVTTKHIPESEVFHPHTEVYSGMLLLGYITRNRSCFARVGENWNFTSQSLLKHFYAATKPEILKQIRQLIP